MRNPAVFYEVWQNLLTRILEDVPCGFTSYVVDATEARVKAVEHYQTCEGCHEKAKRYGIDPRTLLPADRRWIN